MSLVAFGSKSAPRPYEEVVQEFVSSGAFLIRASILERYRGLVPEGTRPLEPGFIPPDGPPRVLIVSYYPNAADLHDMGTLAYEQLRNHFAAWGDTGSLAAYRVAYEDWLSSLDSIPFHCTRTRPILEDVGLRNEDISWIPFVKAPMKAGSSPDDAVIDIDRDETWKQLLLLRPAIVWIQGIKIAERVIPLIRERITDRILPPQSVSQYDSAERRHEDRTKISVQLRRYLGET